MDTIVETFLAYAQFHPWFFIIPIVILLVGIVAAILGNALRAKFPIASQVLLTVGNDLIGLARFIAKAWSAKRAEKRESNFPRVPPVGPAATIACVLIFGLSLQGCGVFSNPKFGRQCFEWCLTVNDSITGGAEAVCYDTEAKMLQAQRAYQSRGVTATKLGK